MTANQILAFGEGGKQEYHGKKKQKQTNKQKPQKKKHSQATYGVEDGTDSNPCHVGGWRVLWRVH